MWGRVPSESPVKYTEISLEIAVCGRAVVMCLTDSANSSSKGVIGRATSQPPQPACHPIPKLLQELAMKFAPQAILF